MIRSLRRRFVWGAMLSLFILLAILISGLLTVGYVRTEKRSNAFMDIILDNDGEFRPQLAFLSAPPGAAPAEHTGYYAISISEQGTVTAVRAMGTWEREHSEIQTLVDEVLSLDSDRGSIYQFKYALRQDEENRL